MHFWGEECIECDFKSESEQMMKTHTLNNHPSRYWSQKIMWDVETDFEIQTNEIQPEEILTNELEQTEPEQMLFVNVVLFGIFGVDQPVAHTLAH